MDFYITVKKKVADTYYLIYIMLIMEDKFMVKIK